jgi:hypothetical protein
MNNLINSIKSNVQTAISLVLRFFFGTIQWETSKKDARVATALNLFSLFGYAFTDAANLVTKQSTIHITNENLAFQPHLWDYFFMNLITVYILWRGAKLIFNLVLNALQKSNSELIRKIAKEIQTSVVF